VVQGVSVEAWKVRTEKGKSVDLKNKDAVDALVVKISSSKKGLSYKQVKKVIADSLGMQRVHESRLEPILELGLSLKMFSVKEGRLVVAELAHTNIDGVARMSAEAQKYYDKASKISPVYISQAEQYVAYCEACKVEGKEAVHPERWMCGDE
jgi:hypothetical protein